MDPKVTPQFFSVNTMRREMIREFIEVHQIVTVEQLSHLLPEVSATTLRQDLQYLRAQGLVEKAGGGARWTCEGACDSPFAERAAQAGKAKEAIAQKAAELLEGCTSVFLDAGTTMMAFARAIPDRLLTVATNAPNIALELASREKIAITLCGGGLNKSSLTLSGAAAIESLAKLDIDIAFLSPSGYSGRTGFTCGIEGEARMKTHVIAKARTSVMLMDSSKLEQALPYTFATLPDIDCLITERAPSQLPAELTRTQHDLRIL